MKVMKFGGTSVGSIESLLNLRDIVNAEPKPVIVVVSAMGGFTNQLLAMCEQAQQRDISCLDILEAARKRHHDAIDGVVEAMREQVHATIDHFFDDSLKPYYLALATNPHMPVDEIERVCDAIVAHGEILSSAIVTGMFEDGVPHLSLNYMRTRPDGAGRILDWSETERLVKADFASLAEGGVHVAQGFISRDTESGAVTNLGRGGSDYTAAILASLLDADALEIWTDVDGFMTADPRTHPDATVIPQMTYAQAQEMCDAGAKVIYPPTIAPVAMKHIPVWVKNTFNPGAPGTVIVDEA